MKSPTKTIEEQLQGYLKKFPFANIFFFPSSILTGLFPPSAGTALINGLDIQV